MTTSETGFTAPHICVVDGATGNRQGLLDGWIERPAPALRPGLKCKCGEPATDLCSQIVDGFIVRPVESLAAGDLVKDFNEFSVCLSFENNPAMATYGWLWTIESIGVTNGRTFQIVLRLKPKGLEVYRQERLMFAGEKFARKEPVPCGVGLCDCCGIDPGRRLCWDHAPLREVATCG